jgi:hypothetical protein
MSTSNISYDKGGRFERLTTLLPSIADCLEIWSLKLLGTSVPVQGCNASAFLLNLVIYFRGG